MDAADLRAEPRVVWPRTEGVEYDSSHAVIDGEDVLFILHNDGALDFELVRVAASDPAGARQVVDPAPSRRAAARRVDVPRLGRRRLPPRRARPRSACSTTPTASVSEIEFDEPLYSVGIGRQPRVGAAAASGSATARSSRRARCYDYDVATGELLLRKRQPVLGGYEPDDYAQARVWATAQDGTQIPISLVWKRSFGDAGAAPRPVHLYGYGSYEHSIEPGLLGAAPVGARPRRRSSRSRTCAAAARWAASGTRTASCCTSATRSPTSSTAPCTSIDHGYTTADRMVAEGGSAGGLLMGAVANLAPELFAGILADVPFVDALTTILDPSLPLTVIEWDEWGDPLHNADVYAYMKSYSPYENVRTDAAYPRILAVTSLNDTRVLYVEPAKWVARLREVGADALLKCEMVAGHGGVSGRYNAWKRARVRARLAARRARPRRLRA